MSDESAPPAEAQAQAPKPKEAKPKQASKAKEKSGSKGKSKGGKGGKGKNASGGLSVAAHPRARAAVRRAKGWGGLGGFAIAAYLSIRSGVPPDQAGLRALGAGVAGYMVAWATMVTVWRHLVLAELRAHLEMRKQAPAGATIPARGGAPVSNESPAPPVTN